MNNEERHRRCLNANGNNRDRCRVYSRRVYECRDCSFSILSRPAYLRYVGIDSVTEET